ncbi:MAG: hypothetical protein HZC40_06795 [Chloroflexi bacterium]|nr:hypothetical protein [Chloroflexota bacterium]
MVPRNPDLSALINLPDFTKEPIRVQQFAIWTITDNPARDAYMPVSDAQTSGGPMTAEFTRIRELFLLAKIQLAK